jgi:L-threonylcarbamoyladenylate synthase
VIARATTEAIRQAADILRRGGIVAFPTETVYGLGANALDVGAVQRVYEVKGRPSTSPLIVHTDCLARARGLAEQWPEEAERLAEKFWPGPLTIVVAKARHVPHQVTAGLPTVGIRIPRNAIALELLRAAQVPVAAPSANPFSQLSPVTAAHVEEALGAQVDLILDGGGCEVGLESTVVSLVGPSVRLLRPGMISRAELEATIGPVEFSQSPPEGAHPAPGMHPRHYSPRTPLLLIDATAGLPPGRVAYLWWRNGRAAVYSLRLPADPVRCASLLYHTLHELDRDHFDAIAVETPPEGIEWEAIRDRLQRAAHRI